MAGCLLGDLERPRVPHGHPSPQASRLVCPEVASLGNFPLGLGVPEEDGFSRGSTLKLPGLCCQFPQGTPGDLVQWVWPLITMGSMEGQMSS